MAYFKCFRNSNNFDIIFIVCFFLIWFYWGLYVIKICNWLMHRLSKKYYFIERFNTTELKNLNSNTTIIFRDYAKKPNITELLKIKEFCKKRNIKVYLANNFGLALRLGFDGAYIPSFNKYFSHLNYSFKKNFELIGSAHNIKEIRLKEVQKIKKIVISSIFKKNKNYLGINRFKNVSKYTDKKIIALGGLTKKNIKKLALTKSDSFAGISFFE